MRTWRNALRARWPFWLPASVVLACAGPWLARTIGRRDAPRERHPFLELYAPQVDRPIVIDAELDGKRVWESDVGSTGNFKDAKGQGMVPYSEARVRWGEGVLYLWLYAGDLDLEGAVAEHDGPVSRDDSFHVEFAQGERVYAIDVSVLGTIADSVCTGGLGALPSARRCDPKWESHAVVAVDRDGTLNRVGDNDEEWIVEMSVPLSSLGIDHPGPGTRIPFGVRRCEVAKAGPGACGSFGLGVPKGEIVLDPHVVEATSSVRLGAMP